MKDFNEEQVQQFIENQVRQYFTDLSDRKLSTLDRTGVSTSIIDTEELHCAICERFDIPDSDMWNARIYAIIDYTLDAGEINEYLREEIDERTMEKDWERTKQSLMPTFTPNN